MSNDTATIETADWGKLPANPLVSVYMLAYRHEKFIAQAIEGVIAQQCDFPIELIIGDDCSPDRTGEIVRDYQHRYPQLIRILTAKRNVGMHANGARCREACRGAFVAICEGDDFWHHSDKLQMQVNLMLDNPNMGVCHTDYDRMTRFRMRRNIHRNHPSPWLARGDAYKALLMEWSVMTCTTMYRKEILQAFDGTEFDNQTWPFGDRNKLLFASLAGPIGYIDVSTATFRKRFGSAMNTSAVANLALALGALECIELFLSRHPVDRDTERLALINLHRNIYTAAFRASRPDMIQESYEWLCSRHAHISPVKHFFRRLALVTRAPLWIIERIRILTNRYLSAA
jgi:glycosyltransferase involved in cell wall biosynthesis